ncbi:MAG: BON domain-containing protein [Chloroflexota bacterium]
MKKWLMGSALGAFVAFMGDPSRGARRRAILRDKTLSLFGKGSHRAETSLERAAGKAHGILHEKLGLAHDNDNPDDKTLTARIESELFKNPETSRENINIDVAEGIVYLRGELPKQSEIDALVVEVRGFRNVKGVENYLHLPGTPAPNKEEALKASK